MRTEELMRPDLLVEGVRLGLVDREVRDPDRAAWMNVTILWREAGRSPHDKRLHALIGELSTRSDVRRELWAAHDVRKHRAEVTGYPVVGGMELNDQALDLDGDPGLSMTVYAATPGTPTVQARGPLACEEAARLLSLA